MSRANGSTAQPQGLPGRPNLAYLKKLAKERLKVLRAEQPGAKLAQAQLLTARDHSFASWRKLKAHVEAARAGDMAIDLPQAMRDLMEAIVKHDAVAVKALLERVPQIMNLPGPHPNWGGRPCPLHVAVEGGDLAVVRTLLDMGADPNPPSETYDRWTPLMLAVHWKKPGIAAELQERGARVGLIEALMLGDDGRVAEIVRDDPKSLWQPMPNNASPLHFARTQDAVRLLLKAGIDPNAVDKYGKTPAERLASGDADPAVVQILIKRGAKAVPWMLASMGKTGQLRIAVRKDASIVRDPAVLAAAITKGRVATVKWLLAQGADPNARVANGAKASMLHIAAWEGQVQVARLLVARGADVAAADAEYKTTPAVWARRAFTVHGRAGCQEIAEFLESLGESDDAFLRSIPARRRGHKIAQWKPLMDAAFTGDVKRAERLLAGGADPNVISTTPHRYRPLHRTIEFKKIRSRGGDHERVVEILLENGADPTLRATFDRVTALQLAAIGEPRFIPLLRARFDPLDIFHAAAIADDRRVAALLKGQLALGKAVDVNGWTPLHYAAASAMYQTGAAGAAAQVRVVGHLLKAGADPMATHLWENEWPIPVLYHCCGRHDNPAVARVLFKAGATPFDNETVYHAADEDHRGCLALIEEFSDPKRLAEECTKALCTQLHYGRSRGAKWLLLHGADPNALHSRFGESALHSAARRGSSDAVLKLLLRHGGNVKRKSAEGQTAIDLAKKCSKSRVLRLLREE